MNNIKYYYFLPKDLKSSDSESFKWLEKLFIDRFGAEEITDFKSDGSCSIVYLPFTGIVDIFYPNIAETGDSKKYAKQMSNLYTNLYDKKDFIFVFVSLYKEDIPDFLKRSEKWRNGKSREVAFLSPLVDPGNDLHIYFVNRELLLDDDNRFLNLISLDDLSEWEDRRGRLLTYCEKNKEFLKETKKLFTQCFFGYKNIPEYKNAWSRYATTHELNETGAHNYEEAFFRPPVSFLLGRMVNQRNKLNDMLKNTIHLLWIDNEADKAVRNKKEKDIEGILSTVFKKNFILDSQDTLEKIKSIEKKYNVVLLDFFLDNTNVYFATDFIAHIEAQKKEHYLTWYFVASSFSEFVNVFTHSGVLYSHHDSAVVHPGDSPYSEKRKILFMQKLIAFLYSKVSPFIKFNDFFDKHKNDTSKEIVSRKIDHIKKFVRRLLQQPDIVQLKYGQNNDIEFLLSTVLSTVKTYENHMNANALRFLSKAEEATNLIKKTFQDGNVNEEFGYIKDFIDNLYNEVSSELTTGQ